MPGDDGTLVMEDAQIVFRNFAGKEGMYNREGDRNFCAILSPQLAKEMRADGWNVKQLKSREEGIPGDEYIQISVGFKDRPPRLVLISSQGRVDLGQHECELLDWVDIQQVDLIVRPYHWSVNGNTGVKAYLKSMFVTMNEDYLELKYNDVPYAEISPHAAIREIEASSDQAPDDTVDAEFVED